MNDNRPRGVTTIVLERPYGRLVLALAFFAAAGAYMASRASSNDRGLVINGIIHLDTDGADVFYASLASLAGIAVAIGLLRIVQLARHPAFRVVMARDTLQLPRVNLLGGDRSTRCATSRSPAFPHRVVAARRC